MKTISNSTLTKITNLLAFLVSQSEDPETMKHVDSVSDAMELELLAQYSPQQVKVN